MAKDFTTIGLMSGTSLDGVDMAVLTTNGEARIQFGAFATHAYQVAEKAILRDALQAAQHWSPDTAWPQEIVQAHAVVTNCHVVALRQFLTAQNMVASDIDLIGFHGQTILHDPSCARTVQIGDAAQLASEMGIDVVADFRSADMQAGGQGAPLVPLYHAALAEKLHNNEPHVAYPLAVLNLGGVGNVTFIGRDGEILGFDTGPGNALLDDWMEQHTHADFDENGALAAQGKVDSACLAQLLDNPYFALAPPKSLDRSAFTLDLSPVLSVADGAATLTAFTATAVAQALPHFPEPPACWIVCGGGRHNLTMMKALAAALGLPLGQHLLSAEAAAWPGDELEAQAFAWLAVRSRLGLPLTLPTITGCNAPTTGGVLFRK